VTRIEDSKSKMAGSDLLPADIQHAAVTGPEDGSPAANLPASERLCLTRLHDAGIAALETGEPYRVIESLAAGLKEITGADHAVVHLIDSGSGELRLVGQRLAPALEKLCGSRGELHLVFTVALQRREQAFVEDVRGPTRVRRAARCCRTTSSPGRRRRSSPATARRSGMASAYFCRPERLTDE
jgi:hypothetical protein